MEHIQPRFGLDRKARTRLERLACDGNTPQKIVDRARIILMTVDGSGVMAIMREIGVSKSTVWRWQEYFDEAGVEGLVKGRSKPPGRKPISAAVKLEVVEKTVKERPANAIHWSVRAMAKEMGISHTSVQRIWAEHGRKPHLVKSFVVVVSALSMIRCRYLLVVDARLHHQSTHPSIAGLGDALLGFTLPAGVGRGR